MDKILFTLIIVFAGLFTGYFLQKSRYFAYGGSRNTAVRKLIQKFVILFMNPVAFTGSVWILDLGNLHLAIMPFAGLLSLTAGGSIAYILARLTRMNRPETGSFFCCGFFTNIGNIGALVCYSFLGETGFAFVPFYKLFEELVYYTAGFPIAKNFGPPEKRERKGRKISIDPMILAVVASITAGFILNISGVQRPDFFRMFNALVIPLSSFLMLVTIGMAMRFGKMSKYYRKALMLIPVKHLAVPAITVLFASYTGLADVSGGIPLKVVLILSSMPMGILGLVPPSLYDLDLDLANTCWFVSLASMFFVVPVLRILTA